MEYFMDIKILHDPEFNSSILMGALFNKFHRSLVTLKSDNIAICFPKYKEKVLGEILRIHSDKLSLDVLMETDWLMGLNDYIQKSNIELIPGKTRFICVRRKQNKYANIARLRRRYAKRHLVTEQESVIAYPDTLEKEFKFPYINIKSSSTNQEKFPFYIEQKVIDKPVSNMDFNSYGLSKTATVPWF